MTLLAILEVDHPPLLFLPMWKQGGAARLGTLSDVVAQCYRPSFDVSVSANLQRRDTRRGPRLPLGHLLSG